MKYYSDDGEYVHDLEWWMDTAREIGHPIVVELQKRDTSGDGMWCLAQGEHIYPSDDCGRRCRYYAPKNKVRGCCIQLRSCCVGTGKYYRITEHGSVRFDHD